MNLKLDVSSFSIVIVYIKVLAPNKGDDDQLNIRPHLWPHTWSQIHYGYILPHTWPHEQSHTASTRAGLQSQWRDKEVCTMKESSIANVLSLQASRLGFDTRTHIESQAWKYICEILVLGRQCQKIDHVHKLQVRRDPVWEIRGESLWNSCWCWPLAFTERWRESGGRGGGGGRPSHKYAVAYP